MAGGKGSRMKTQEEKLLLKYVHPTILHVIYALQNTNYFSKIIAATNLILRSMNEDVLVVPGDLPLLDDEII